MLFIQIKYCLHYCMPNPGHLLEHLDETYCERVLQLKGYVVLKCLLLLTHCFELSQFDELLGLFMCAVYLGDYLECLDVTLSHCIYVETVCCVKE